MQAERFVMQTSGEKIEEDLKETSRRPELSQDNNFHLTFNDGKGKL